MKNASDTIRHDEKAFRFELTVEGKTAELTYRLKEGSIVFLHTEVPAELEGRGIGAKLVVAGLDFARRSALKVVPECPFVASYLRKHPTPPAVAGPDPGDRRDR